MVIFQDDVKYNQITTTVGQYLASSDVIQNAIKGHLDNQDKPTQEQKEVPKEVKTLLQNIVQTEANKQWQAKFGKSTSITEKDLANMKRSATKIVLGETKQKSTPEQKKNKKKRRRRSTRRRKARKIEGSIRD